MAEYKVLVDWDDDGDYSEASEDITAYAIELEWSLGMRQPWQQTADEQTLSLTLRNADRLFSPEAGGSLAGSLRPQKVMEVQSRYGGATITHWRGWIESVEPTYGERGELRTTITGAGPKRYIQDAEVHLPLLENVTGDRVLTDVFGQVVYPVTVADCWLAGIPGHSEAGETTYATDTLASLAFETGKHTFNYVDTLDRVSGWEAIQQVCAAERGRFFFDRAGNAVFWNRHHLLMDTTVDGTITRFHQFRYGYGTGIINHVTVKCRPRSLSAGTVDLWTLAEALPVRGGDTARVSASYTEADSDISVAGIEVERPNVDNGTLQANSDISLILFEESAQGASLEFLNNGTSEKTVTTATIRGRKLTDHRAQDMTEQDDIGITTYGRRVMTIDCSLMDDPLVAQDMARYELALRKDPRGEVSGFGLMRKAADETAELSRTVTMGSRLRLTEAQTGYDGDVFVIGERHSLREGLRIHEAQFTCEPAEPLAFWLAGVTGYSEAGQTTIAGF